MENSVLKFKPKDKTTTYSKTIIRTNLIIVLFAIVFTFVIEINNWKSIESEFATRSALLAKRHNSYFSQVMYTCRFIVDKGRTDKKYSDYYGEFDITSKLEIIEELGEMKMLSPFYEYIFFIDRQYENIFGSTGEYNATSFFNLLSGLTADDIKDFTESQDDLRIYRAHFRSSPYTMILMKADKRAGSMFFFILNEETLVQQIDISLQDEQLSENIFNQDRLIFSHENQSEKGRSIKWEYPLNNDLIYVFEINVLKLFSTSFLYSIPYLAVLYIVTILCMIGAKATIRAWNKPIEQILTHIAPQTAEKGETKKELLSIIDEFDSLKKLNLSYNHERLLFRLLFSKNEEEITKCLNECKAQGLSLNGNYFFAVICPTEGDYIMVADEFGSIKNIVFHKLYVSDTEIAVIVCASADLITLQSVLRSLAQKTPNTIISEITDKTALIPKCFSLAEQTLMNSKNPNPSIYPNEDIKILKMAIDMKSVERIAISFRQLLIIAEKCEKKLKTTILYDICNMLCTGKEKEELIDNRFNTEYLEIFAQKIYSRILNEIENDNNPTAEFQRNISSIEAYIKEHCTQKDYSMKALAYAFNMSYTNLCHYYKANTGQTISEFTERFKINNAVKLLKSGMKVYDVADKLGYNSSQTFSRVFKKYKGILPKEYVKNFK